jgi:serine/threonine protein kinase
MPSKQKGETTGTSTFKSLLPESFIWHVLFHLSAALARCHHGLGLRRESFREQFEAGVIIDRLRRDMGFDAPSKFDSATTRIRWQAERLSFYCVEPFEPVIHRDIKPRNSKSMNRLLNKESLLIGTVLLGDPEKTVGGDDWRQPSSVSLGVAVPFCVYPIILLGDFGVSVEMREATTSGVGSADFRAPVSSVTSIWLVKKY